MDDFTWKLMLRAAPSKVFCSLVRAASQKGRVCGVEGYGTVLTFTPTRQGVDLAGRMRASVRPCAEGALVTIAATDPQEGDPGSVALQAGSVATLIHQLRRHYEEQDLAAAS